MCAHFDRMEKLTPTELAKTQGPCDLRNPFESEEAGYLLTALKLNNFDNALNAIEHFLSHVEIVDDTRPFESAAILLGTILAQFAKIDKDGDNALSKQDIDQSVRAEDNIWVSCHFDALTHAQLIGDHASGITRAALQNAHDVFIGMSYLHKNFEKVMRFCRSNTQTITAEDLELYVAAHSRELKSDEIAGLLQLALYLRHLHGQRTASSSPALSDGDLLKLTPEALWREAPAPKPE